MSRGQDRQQQSNQASLTPLNISYEKLFPMIRELSEFRWPEPIKMDPTKRDGNRKCANHKEHGHTTKQCRSLHYLVEKWIRVGHLKQYIWSKEKCGKVARNLATTILTTLAAPKAIINYIHGRSIDDKYNSKWKRQRLLRVTSIRERVSSIQPELVDRGMRPIDGVITFPLVDPNPVLQPHQDVLILTLGINDFDVRRILVDPGSSADLLRMSAFKQMGFTPSALENPRRILLEFNGASTISLGNIVLPIQAGPIILNVQFSMVEDLSPFNAIMGCTWLGMATGGFGMGHPYHIAVPNPGRGGMGHSHPH